MHGRTASDQRQSAVFVFPRAFDLRTTGHGLRDCLRQFVEIERLGEIFESFAVASAHRRIERVLSRQHDYRHVGSHSSDRVDRRQTVAIGKHDVGQHHIENAIAEKSVSPRYRVAGNDFEPFFAQRLGDNRRDAPVVFDQ